MVEWSNGDNHSYEWPSEEAGEDEKRMTEEVLHSSGVASTLNVAYSNAEAIRRDPTSGIKRMCQLDDDSDLITDEIQSQSGRRQIREVQLFSHECLELCKT